MKTQHFKLCQKFHRKKWLAVKLSKTKFSKHTKCMTISLSFRISPSFYTCMSMWTKPNTHTKTDGPSNTFYYYYFSSHFCRGCHWFPCPQESMPLCLHLPSAAQVRWLIINLFLVWRWRVWPCGGWRPGQISLSISLDNGQQTME